MGRGKIEMKKIENNSSRHVTFSKRRAGLLKKAKELSILCDAEVAVIVISNSGNLYEYSSSEMQQIIARYNECPDSTEGAIVEHKTETEKEDSSKMVEILRDEIAKLETNQLRLLGKDLTGLNLMELQNLEKQLNEGLLSVKEKKEEILMRQLEQSRLQEQRIMLENEFLRRQVQDLHSLFLPTQLVVPYYLPYHHNTSSISPNLAGTSGNEKGGSDTTLQLGFPIDIPHERKTPEKETSSDDSESQMSLP